MLRQYSTDITFALCEYYKQLNSQETPSLLRSYPTLYKSHVAYVNTFLLQIVNFIQNPTLLPTLCILWVKLQKVNFLVNIYFLLSYLFSLCKNYKMCISQKTPILFAAISHSISIKIKLMLKLQTIYFMEDTKIYVAVPTPFFFPFVIMSMM